MAALACSVGGPEPTPTVPPAAEQAQVPTSQAQAEAEPAGPPSPITGEAVQTIAFPRQWSYTAIKIGDLVPPPGFLTVAQPGTLLPWLVDVRETCLGDDCSYSSVIRPFITEGILGDIPSATWEVQGRDWTLEASWLSTQSDFGDGTVCAIANHWTYVFTVLEAEIVGDRPVAKSVTGTWTTEGQLDLGASTGDISRCGGEWATAEVWSLIARTGGAWGDVELARLLSPEPALSAMTGEAAFEPIAASDPDGIEQQFTTEMDILIDQTLGSIMITNQSDTDAAGTSFGPLFTVADVGGMDRIGFAATGTGEDSIQMYAGFVAPYLRGEPVALQDLADVAQVAGLDVYIDAWGYLSSPRHKIIAGPGFDQDTAMDPVMQMLQLIYAMEDEQNDSAVDQSLTPRDFLIDLYDAGVIGVDTESLAEFDYRNSRSTDIFGRWFDAPAYGDTGQDVLSFDRGTEVRFKWPLDL